MTIQYIMPLSDLSAKLHQVGGKGASLTRLFVAGLPVPDGFHITTDAYRRFVQENNLQLHIEQALQGVDPSQPSTFEAASKRIQEKFLAAHIPQDLVTQINRAYALLAGQYPNVSQDTEGGADKTASVPVAVRSSATAEDLPEASFAGQQDTFLNINCAQSLLDAVRKCWASLWNARAIGYRLRQEIPADQITLAVVVQVLIPAEKAGILFTANPMNGRHDQTVINASWGLGEAIVGGSVNPDLFIVDKSSNEVLSREIADKQEMTVRTKYGTQNQSVPDNLRQEAVLDDQAVAELNLLGVQVENLYGMPMDVEWAMASGKFYILQARPVTALQEPAQETRLEWTLPDPKAQYMRASICELMPDPLSPLFDSMGMLAIEDGINEMAFDLLNMPNDTFSGYMQTINGYAYQKVSFTRRQWWLMLTRMGPRTPGMLKKGVHYWQNVAYPRYAQAAKCWQNKPLQGFTPNEIWAGVQEIMKAYAHHLGSLMASTMGPTAGSEGLFTQVYSKMVRREGDPPAPVFLMGFDSLPVKAEKGLFDLSIWIKEQPSLLAHLNAASAAQVSNQLAARSQPEDVPGDIWSEFQSRFHKYLEDYGYMIYDMDFSKPLPMEEPEPILETLKLFLSGRGKNPYERQQASIERRKASEELVRRRLKGFKRWAFEKSLKWAQSQAPLREDGIADIGMGYPALRRMLLELGARFSKAGAVSKPEDVFWMKAVEVELAAASLSRNENPEEYHERVSHRKALWEKQKQLIAPAQLPPGKRYLGMNMESMLAVGESTQQGATIKGVGASPGQVKGTARVLFGPQDFDQMHPGDVLVASITTPAWTPLFALASAVVTDIGGPLSHGSIVAREYGIPAVMGTGVGTRRIRSGQTITVDGSTGTVILYPAMD